MRDKSSAPIFAQIPEAIEERLQLAMEFAGRWSGDCVVPSRNIGERIRAAETRLGRCLPLTLQQFYESGLHEWFVSHADEHTGQHWLSVDELAFDERTGALTIMEFGVLYSIRPEDLSESDPPVREYKVMGPYSEPPFKVIAVPSAISLSEMLIREVLMAASEVVPDERHWVPLEWDRPDGRRIETLRQELAHVPINGLKNETHWRFYEGSDLLYQETDPNIRQKCGFYALLAGRSPAVIEEFRQRTRLLVDWRRNQELLIEGSDAALRTFLAQHPEDKLCAIGYVFELGNAHPQFDLCANTRRYFDESMLKYRNDWPDTDEDQVRWNSGDYEYPAGLTGVCDELGAEWSAESDRLHHSADTDEHCEEVYNGLITICCRALAVLAQRGHFCDPSAIDFNVSEVGDSDQLVKERDQQIRKLITDGV